MSFEGDRRNRDKEGKQKKSSTVEKAAKQGFGKKKQRTRGNKPLKERRKLRNACWKKTGMLKVCAQNQKTEQVMKQGTHRQAMTSEAGENAGHVDLKKKRGKGRKQKNGCRRKKKKKTCRQPTAGKKKMQRSASKGGLFWDCRGRGWENRGKKGKELPPNLDSAKKPLKGREKWNGRCSNGAKGTRKRRRLEKLQKVLSSTSPPQTGPRGGAGKTEPPIMTENLFPRKWGGHGKYKRDVNTRIWGRTER